MRRSHSTLKILDGRMRRFADAQRIYCSINVMSDENPWFAKRIVYEIDEMDAISPPGYHLYSDRPGRPAVLRAYRPKSLGRTPTRGVVFIHGGPVPLHYPAPTDWGQYKSWGQLAAATGSIGLTFDHGYTDFNRLEDAARDVESALSYIRSHAEEFDLDPNRICLWACSGGGPFLSAALREQPDYIRCIVAYYAYMDLRKKPEVVGVLPADVLHRYSPAAWISEQRDTGPPIFMAKARLDDPVLNQGIDEFVSQAKYAGLSVDTHFHESGNHGFDVNDDDSTSRSIIKSTIEFIDRNT